MKLKLLLSTAVFCGLLASPAQASIIEHQSGTWYQADSVVDGSTGADLSGMEVTVCYVTDICQTVNFDGSLGGNSYGAAIGSDWQLSLAGDSFNVEFIFTAASPVTLLHLNGVTSNTAFDTKSTNQGSPGSNYGRPFALVSIAEDPFAQVDFAPTSVIYSNEVWLNGVFHNDLYTSLAIHFDANGVMGTTSFFTDTDQVTGLQVPTPATLLLMLAGLIALRQRKSA